MAGDVSGEDGGSAGPGPDEVYCTSCGEIIAEAAEICPECGVRQRSAPSDGSSDRAVKVLLLVVVGVPVAIAITVILSAVVGTFVLGLGSDVQENVQAGVNVQGDPADDAVTATYVSEQNADTVLVTFEYPGGTAEAEMTEVGDRVRLTPAGLTTQGAATVRSPATPPPAEDADVDITVVARRGDESTVVLVRTVGI